MKTLFKKIFVIAFTIILSGLASVSHGQQMTVNGYDAANPKTGDEYELTWMVKLYNDAHTDVISFWESSDLSISNNSYQYPGSNLWSFFQPFSIIGGANVPVIQEANFQVTCCVKRRQSGEIVAGGQGFSTFLTTAQLIGSFSVNVIIN